MLLIVSRLAPVPLVVGWREYSRVLSLVGHVFICNWAPHIFHLQMPTTTTAGQEMVFRILGLVPPPHTSPDFILAWPWNLNKLSTSNRQINARIGYQSQIWNESVVNRHSSTLSRSFHWHQADPRCVEVTHRLAIDLCSGASTLNKPLRG